MSLHNPRLQGRQAFFLYSQQKNIMGENGPENCSSEPIIFFCGLQATHVVTGNHYVYLV